MCSNYDVAARLASIIITFMILYSGYLIPVYSMKRWLFWIVSRLVVEERRVALTVGHTRAVLHQSAQLRLPSGDGERVRSDQVSFRPPSSCLQDR